MLNSVKSNKPNRRLVILFLIITPVAYYLGGWAKKCEITGWTDPKSKSNTFVHKASIRPNKPEVNAQTIKYAESESKFESQNLGAMDENEFGQFLMDLMRICFDDPKKGLILLSKYEKVGDASKLDIVYGMYGVAFAKKDPDAALEWAKSISDSSLQSSTLTSIFSEISKSDPLGTLKEVKVYLDRGWAGPIISQCLQNLAKNSPNDAIDWVGINLRNNPSQYYSSMASIFSMVGSRNPDQLLNILKISDFGADESLILSGSIFGMASLNFMATCDFIRKLEVDEKTSLQLLSNLSSSGYFAKNPDAIVDIVLEKAPGNVVNILGPAVSSWVREDLKPALQWFDRQNVEMQKDLLRQGLISSVAASNPNLAIDTVEGLGFSRDEKVIMFKEITNVWGGASPGDSLNWIGSLDARVQKDIITSWCDALQGIDPKVGIAFLNSTTKLHQEALNLAKIRLSAPIK